MSNFFYAFDNTLKIIHFTTAHFLLFFMCHSAEAKDIWYFF